MTSERTMVVPETPTEAMVRAGVDANPTAWTDETDRGFPEDVARDVYAAMTRAAPPTAPSGDREAKPWDLSDDDCQRICGLVGKSAWDADDTEFMRTRLFAICRTINDLSAKVAQHEAGDREAVAWIRQGALETVQEYGSTGGVLSRDQTRTFCVPLYTAPPAQPAEERAVIERFRIQLPDGNTAEVRPNEAGLFAVWVVDAEHVDGEYCSASGFSTFVDAVRNITDVVWGAATPFNVGE